MRVETSDGAKARREGMMAEERLAEQQDDRLVSEAVGGSSAAFGVLFDRYERKMYHMTLRVLRNREDAEDAVQQAFERAFVHLNSFQGSSRFSTWLTRIAINEALMMLRKRRPGQVSLDGNTAMEEEGVALEIEDSAATPEEQYEQQELHGILSDAIGELGPILRNVVRLHDIAELTTGKTAKAMGLSDGTVKARSFRARRTLRRKLAERLGTNGRKAAGSLFLQSGGHRSNVRQTGLFANAV